MSSKGCENRRYDMPLDPSAGVKDRTLSLPCRNELIVAMRLPECLRALLALDSHWLFRRTTHLAGKPP